MMRDFMFIFKHDLRHMLTRGEAILWVFVMPLVFFFLIGSITGGAGNGGATIETMLLHGSEEAGALSESLTRRLVVRPSADLPADHPRRQPLPDRIDARLPRLDRPLHAERLGAGAT